MKFITVTFEVVDTYSQEALESDLFDVIFDEDLSAVPRMTCAVVNIGMQGIISAAMEEELKKD